MTLRVPVPTQGLSASEFHARWRPFLLERVRALACRPDDAEDLVGETFLVCLRRPEILELDAQHVRRLLAVALRNRVIDQRRRRQALAQATFDSADERVPTPLGVLVDREAQGRARDLWERLFAHLDALRAKLRSTQGEALDAYLNGADDYRAAAVRAGLTESQLTQRIHSAVHRLYASLDSTWRRNLAPLRRLQAAETAEVSPERRGRLRLLELLARRARKQVKRDTERFVRNRVRHLPADVRSVFDRWISSGLALVELSESDRDVAEEIVLDIAGALHSQDSRLVALLLGSLGRSERATRRPVGQGPGAESPLLRWCLRDLRPRLALPAPDSAHEDARYPRGPFPTRPGAGSLRAVATTAVATTLGPRARLRGHRTPA